METRFRNLTVYKKVFPLAMDIYHVSKKFLMISINDLKKSDDFLII